MGPRLFGQGKPILPGPRRADRSASMGPRLFGQGKLSQGALPDCLGPLQWGLACSGKVSIPAPARSNQWPLLQWGLACSGKVRRPSSMALEPMNWSASMGPRLFGQGKPSLTAPCQCRERALQWGLACSGKVSSSWETTTDGAETLQWGLACSGKVSHHHHHQAIGAAFASMGPRLFGQGKISSVRTSTH